MEQPDQQATSNSTRPRETLKILYDHPIPNVPGKSLIGISVTYPPNGATPPHRHGGATVMALVTSGKILSGMNGNPPQVYGPGESFIEKPGCHHTVGENVSEEEEAVIIAQFIVDTSVVVEGGYEALVVLDED